MVVENKALRINKDLKRYGTFAEIGAGQEVARHFFQAGKASQTIAKTISAYDMTFSDEIYGREKNGRYVCESRLEKMLDHEFSLLVQRLDKKRGADTCFFALANTVATGSGANKQSHGWMGVRFQSEPRGLANEVVLHVRMLDRYRLQQQEALGTLGVNLIDAAFYHQENPEAFIDYLVEFLKEGQIVIDVIKFKGPQFTHFDECLVNLELVHKGLAEAILFSPQKNILNISDSVYGKNILIQRGTYRPVTNTHLDVLQKGILELEGEIKKQKLKETEILPMMELTMNSLESDGDINEKDFLERIETLTSLGYHVLISKFNLYFDLKRFFRRYNSNIMALVVGASHLEKIFSEQHYANLEGGLLEGLGKLLDSKTKLLVYPHKTTMTCFTAKSFFPPEHLRHVYSYFIDNDQIVDISGCEEIQEYLHSQDVKKLMDEGSRKWEALVPEKVKDLIISKKLFGYK
ncbi:MAG: hypothetical protein ACOYOK_10580 [Pseudobdellovibrionaceae bacterium]